MENQPGNLGTVPRVAIIGCGRIGSWFDEEDDSGRVLSHAGAYKKSGAVRLVALCDIDRKRLQECGLRRGVRALYEDYRALLKEEEIDILSVCTPVDRRFAVLEAAFRAGIKVVFCEKPVVSTLEEALRANEAAYRNGSTVVVNYFRRWDPGIGQVARIIKEGRIGRVQSVTCYYNKGILNNGSHGIDLLNLFWGLPFRVRTLRVIDDGYDDLDRTMDCVFEYETESSGFSAYLIGSDWRHFSIFELDVIGSGGRVRLTEKGQEIQLSTVGADSIFPGYSILKNPEVITTNFECGLLDVIQDLVDIWRGGSPETKSGIEETIDVLRVIEALRESMNSGYSPVNLKEN